MRHHSEWLLERRQHLYWDDLRSPGNVGRQGAAFPTWDTTEIGWRYSNNPPANQQTQYISQMPHKWAEGTDVEPHIHWYLTVAGAAGEDVVWRHQWRIASAGGTFPAAFTSNDVTVDVSAYGVREHLITAFPAVSMAGETVSCCMQSRIVRVTSQPADDHESDVIMVEFDIHYQVDTPGSWQEYSKW